MNNKKLYLVLIFSLISSVSLNKPFTDKQINIVFVPNNECISCNVGVNNLIKQLNTKKISITFFTNSFNTHQKNKMKKDLGLIDCKNCIFVNDKLMYNKLINDYNVIDKKHSIILFTIKNKKKSYLLLDVVKSEKRMTEIISQF